MGLGQLVRRGISRLGSAAASLAIVVVVATGAQAQNKLLDEAVEFTGALLFLETKVPALVLGVVRGGETAVAGFGKARPDADGPPDRNTLLRIGSITKVFTGAVLASLVADRVVNFTDPLQQRLGWDVKIPSKEGKHIRLIDLVTHASGLPREIERAPSPREDPFRSLTKEAFVRNLQGDALLFAPGTGALYSNFAFDLLAQALANAAGRSYEDLLRERVLKPAGLAATTFAPGAEQLGRLMPGHDFDGTPLPNVPTAAMMVGSGGLYSTADDILRWIAWHLDRFSTENAEMRLLDHAAYLHRDSLRPVFGLDEVGRMDAIGLGWVIMEAKDGRPLILQKAGGLQGTFSYMAFAPAHRIGVFVAINQFNLGAAKKMAEVANELIDTLSPR